MVWLVVLCRLILLGWKLLCLVSWVLMVIMIGRVGRNCLVLSL